MNIGKVPGNVLKRSVVNLIGKGPKTGVDCAYFESEDAYVVSASGVGLVNSEIAPMLAVYKACNNIWAAGGDVLGIEAAFMISDSTKERDLKKLTRRTMEACAKCNTVLCGGHTEVSDSVNRPISTVTAVGSMNSKPKDVRQIKPGMDIVMTKWAGIEEAAILMNSVAAVESLKGRFSEYYMDSFVQHHALDAIILGCTHYPLIKKNIERLYPRLDIINPSDIVAGRIREVLDDRDGFARGSDFTNVFYASDLSENFINMIDNIFKDKEKKVKFLNFDLERELGQ